MQLETILVDNHAIAIPTDHDPVVRLHMLTNRFRLINKMVVRMKGPYRAEGKIIRKGFAALATRRMTE